MTIRMRSNAILSVACAAVLLGAMTDAHIRAAPELPQNLVLHKTPKPVAPIKFVDQRGQIHNLAEFKGKVVVLNIWATWCVPCRKEMPTLDRLQAALGGPDLEVVPVSIDLGGIDAVRKFYADIAVNNLAMYVDTSGQASRELGAIGLPTTLIVDRGGLEVGRIIGPAEWDSAEIAQYLKTVIATRDDTANSVARADPANVAETNRDAPGVLQRGLDWLRAIFGK